MASKNTNYAIDLSNDGVSFWHRGEDMVWQQLVNVSLGSEGLYNDIETLKAGNEANCEDGKFAAQVRIPRSEVFVSQIDLEGLTEAAAISKIKSFLSEKTPYKAQDLLFDLEKKGTGKISYVAAIAKKTAKEAKEFILDYGFEVSFYTSKIDKTEFPRNPRFYDGKPPIVAPPLRTKSVKEAPKKAKVDEITPPPPPQKTTPQPALSAESKTVGLQTEVNTKDTTSFETTRRKPLVAPNKSGKKTEPSIANTPPPPPRRISIDLPKPVEKTASGAIKNPITMPQGGGIKTNTGGFLKLKYVLIAAAIIVAALLYWFFTELFDGKEEIARLQETPIKEPTAAIELDVLVPVISNDEVPEVTIVEVPETQQIPILKTPNLAAAPKPLLMAKDPIQVAGSAQLIIHEQVIEKIDQVAKTDAVEQNLSSVETETPAIESVSDRGQESDSLDETASPDLQTELAAGELIPTKDGTLGAEGITLYAGTPDIIPPHREQLKISNDPLKNVLPKMRSQEFEKIHKTETIAEPTSEVDSAEIAAVDSEAVAPDLLALADTTLKSTLPKVRPASIQQKAKVEQSSLLAKANPVLAGLKPKIRPRNLSIPKQVVEVEKIDPREIEVAVNEAVRDSARPRARPRSLSKVVAKAKASTTENSRTAALTPSAAAGTSKVSPSSPADVQKEATERAGFSKRRISLIGVYGTASSRRALVRLPTGRYVKVKAGQRVSGWKVSAIGESSVRITKGSRNQVLRMPK